MINEHLRDVHICSEERRKLKARTESPDVTFIQLLYIIYTAEKSAFKRESVGKAKQTGDFHARKYLWRLKLALLLLGTVLYISLVVKLIS